MKNHLEYKGDTKMKETIKTGMCNDHQLVLGL